MTNGASISIVGDPLTHSVFSMSSIMDSEIHMPDLSHLVHASPLDGAQPSDFQESAVVLFCDLLDYLEARSTHGAHSFALFDPMPSLCSYMITCTHPLCVNEDGDMIHSLGQLFHLSRAHFISTGSNFKSSHHLGADYKSQYPSVFPSHHWISVVLHGPSIHLAVVYVFYPGEKIYLLPKKNIPPNIKI